MLEQKKKELSIIKAQAAIAELEYKILERHEDIKRMEDHIELQKKIIEDLKEDLEKQ